MRSKLEICYIIVWGVTVLCRLCSVTSLSHEQTQEQTERVCIVGAGVAGLASARHLLAAGQSVTVLEATPYIGGTWRYDPRVGKDEYGRPIHTSMYKNLRSNVPHQLMELPGFEFPAGTPSFLNATTYYQYLLDYADFFELRNYIKFLHEVKSIARTQDTWRVVYTKLDTGETFKQEFDYVLVCVGHYSKPRLPKLPGENIFKGTLIHSHDYRMPDVYKDRRVLVVGGGPSALDLITALTKTSSSVLHSHHSPDIRTPFPANYCAKPDVAQFTEQGALFKDGTYEDVDDVIYATGYELNFPFLDESTGLVATPSTVTPLYRTIVNIQEPTMLIVGLTYHACAIITIATQARYAASVVVGRANLPSQEEMYADWRRQQEKILNEHKSPSEIHAINVGLENLEYYYNLTWEADIAPVPPVLPAMCARDGQAKLDNFYTFREYTYTVLDDDNFVREPPPEPPREARARRTAAPPRTGGGGTRLRTRKIRRFN